MRKIFLFRFDHPSELYRQSLFGTPFFVKAQAADQYLALIRFNRCNLAIAESILAIFPGHHGKATGETAQGILLQLRRQCLPPILVPLPNFLPARIGSILPTEPPILSQALSSRPKKANIQKEEKKKAADDVPRNGPCIRPVPLRLKINSCPMTILTAIFLHSLSHSADCCHCCFSLIVGA